MTMGSSTPVVNVSERLSFAETGVVAVKSGKVELGQGILTALTQIAADELEVDHRRIRIVSGDTGGPNEWFTAGSQSVEVSGQAIQMHAALARTVILAHAAAKLGIDPGTLAIDDGTIVANGSKTALTYWSLARDINLDCVTIRQPIGPVLRRLVGASLPRIDLPPRVVGAPFLHDLSLPEMLHGRIVRSPRPGARLTDIDTTGLPPEITVVRNGSFLGVIAGREWSAVVAATKMARAARWDATLALHDDPRNVFATSNAVPETVMSPDRPPGTPSRVVQGTFSRPFLAHASIGPSCAIARWAGQRLEVWTHSQGVFALRASLAIVFGVPEDGINVHHVPGAGCYGHNGADDAALDAALLARDSEGRPVRVVWTRADELAWSPLGSAMTTKATIGLDETNSIQSFEIDIESGTHGARPGANGKVNLLGANDIESRVPLEALPDLPLSMGGGAERNAQPVYDCPAVTIRKRIVPLPVRTSSLRALGAYTNVFAIEALMDDAAVQVGEDPIAFRLRHLSDPRAREVLRLAAEMSGWPRPSRADGTLGLGFARYKNKAAYCCVVVEVELGDNVKVRRCWSAVDAGLVINPDGASNQVEGGIIQSISWTLKEAVTFDHAVVSSRDWESYPILRFSEAPEQIEVRFVDRPTEAPLGIGEVAQGPTAAAIGNAVARALGTRIHDLPITRDRIVAEFA